jgi:hypothetical protein
LPGVGDIPDVDEHQGLADLVQLPQPTGVRFQRMTHHAASSSSIADSGNDGIAEQHRGDVAPAAPARTPPRPVPAPSLPAVSMVAEPTTEFCADGIAIETPTPATTSGMTRCENGRSGRAIDEIHADRHPALLHRESRGQKGERQRQDEGGPAPWIRSGCAIRAGTNASPALIEPPRI